MKTDVFKTNITCELHFLPNAHSVMYISAATAPTPLRSCFKREHLKKIRFTKKQFENYIGLFLDDQFVHQF